jgi:hypothetical protein
MGDNLKAEMDFNRGVKQIILGSAVTVIATILLLTSIVSDNNLFQYISAGLLIPSTVSLLAGLYNSWKGVKNIE